MFSAHRLDRAAIKIAAHGAIGCERVEIRNRAGAPPQCVIERPALDPRGLRLRPDLAADAETCPSSSVPVREESAQDRPFMEEASNASARTGAQHSSQAIERREST